MAQQLRVVFSALPKDPRSSLYTQKGWLTTTCAPILGDPSPPASRTPAFRCTLTYTQLIINCFLKEPNAVDSTSEKGLEARLWYEKRCEESSKRWFTRWTPSHPVLRLVQSLKSQGSDVILSLFLKGEQAVDADLFYKGLLLFCCDFKEAGLYVNKPSSFLSCCLNLQDWRAMFIFLLDRGTSCVLWEHAGFLCCWLRVKPR